MQPLPDEPRNHWKTYLHISDRLMQMRDTTAQYELIYGAIKDQLNADARVWFSDRYYPLPGDMEIPLLIESEVPDFVWRRWQEVQTLEESASLEKTLSYLTETDADGRLTCLFPLRYQQVNLGLFMLQRDSPEPLTSREIDFLDGLLTHAAIALQTYRVMALKNWRNDQLALVRSVSSKVASISDLDRLFQQVAGEIQKTFRYYFVSIYTHDSAAGQTRLRASSGSILQEAPAEYIDKKISRGIIGQAAASGQEIYICDVKNGADHGGNESLPQTLSEVAFPLKVEDEILGVLGIENCQPLGLNENDLLVLRSLADAIALAIEQANLFERLQRRAGQIGAVVEVGNVISSILDFEALMNEIVRIIQNRFNYPFVHIFTVDEECGRVIFEAGVGSRSDLFQEKELTYAISDPLGIIPWVARSNQTRIVNDVACDPLYRPSEIQPQETLSEIAVPLSFGGKVLGVLDIQSDRQNAFDDKDRFLFEALGATLAIAMRNAALYRREQWRTNVADGFRDVANLVRSDQALDQLLGEILDKLETYLPCDASAIWLLDQNDRTKDIPSLKLAAAHCIDPQIIVRSAKQSVEARQWLEKAALISEATIRQPKDAFCPLGVALAYSPEYSSIAAPLQAGDTPLGILTLAHHKPDRYNAEARSMTTTFASYAAVAIQNSRLFSQAQEQAWISSLLLKISEIIQGVDSIPLLFERIAQHIPLLVEVKNCAFFLMEENGKSFVLHNTYGEQTPAPGSVYLLTDAPLFAQLAANFHSQQPLHGSLAGFKSAAGETLLLYPLAGRDKLHGAFCVTLSATTGPDEEFEADPQTLAILQGLVNQVAVAVENLDLIERSQQDAYVTAALLQVARAVVSQNELTDILATIVQLVPILVGVQACMIYLWDENRRLFTPGQINTGSHEQDQILLTQNFKPGEFKLLDTVRKQDKIVHCPIPNGAQSPLSWKKFACIAYNPDDEVFLKENKNWVIGLPLSVKGVVHGVLLVQETSGRPFAEKRLEILTGIARQTALSIQNDELDREIVDREKLESEFQLALQVQKTFLPEWLPEIGGWDIDARWQPARQVGGDLYDIIDMGGGQAAIVIADVSDKGIPAALYMTVTRTLIRAALQVSHDPAAVLEYVNNLLVMESLNGMFVTAIFAVLSIHTGKLVYASAGHNPPLILRKSGRKIDTLEKGGMALGITRDFKLQNHNVTLHEEDVMLLYTDGVTESFSPAGEAFGEDHLRLALTADSFPTTNELLSAVEKSASDFRAGRAPTDDVTLVGVRRLKQRQKRLFSK